MREPEPRSCRRAATRAALAAGTLWGGGGIGFWNLGPEVAPQSHDVNASTPITWAEVQSH